MKVLKLSLVSCFLCACLHLQAQVTFAPLFNEQSVFNNPLEIQNAADGSNRLFVVEQPGTIKVFPNTPNIQASQIQTFLDIRNRVFFRGGEEIGLLGLAFHPNFINNNANISLSVVKVQF